MKAAGYASTDPGLISKFNSGEDIYIFSSKLYLGDKFDTLDKKQKKMWRKRFKTVFLGVLYGLGKKSLAERLNATEEEAEDIIQGLYKSFPKLRDYVADQKAYVMSHGGYINTMLGDKLKVQEWRFYEQATSAKDKQNLKARIERLGVNLPIQGGTSSIMCSGFFNNIRLSCGSPLWDNYISDPSTLKGWNNNRGLKPIIVVHDSNTNYVPIEKIFDIRKYYDENYTSYAASFGPRIVLLFDLLCGDAYERAMDMKNLDEYTIQFSGSADSMLKMYDKIMGFNFGYQVECDMKREDLVPEYVQDPIQRFILEKGTCIIKDLSNYTVTFKRLV